MADDKKDSQPETTPDGTRVVRTEGRDFRVEGNNVDGYVGVSPEYRNYADDRQKPFTTDADVALLLKSGQATDVEALTESTRVRKEREDHVRRVEAGEDFDEVANADNEKSDNGDDASDEEKKEAAKKAAPETPSTPAPAKPTKATTPAASSN